MIIIRCLVKCDFTVFKRPSNLSIIIRINLVGKRLRKLVFLDANGQWALKEYRFTIQIPLIQYNLSLNCIILILIWQNWFPYSN